MSSFYLVFLTDTTWRVDQLYVPKLRTESYTPHQPSLKNRERTLAILFDIERSDVAQQRVDLRSMSGYWAEFA